MNKMDVLPGITVYLPKEEHSSLSVEEHTSYIVWPNEKVIVEYDSLKTQICVDEIF